jgi:hypothetical protein
MVRISPLPSADLAVVVLRDEICPGGNSPGGLGAIHEDESGPP